MTQQPTQADRARWTPGKQRLFLKMLFETGSVAQAAKIAGMSPSSAHRLRRRLAGTPFDAAWSNVLAEHRRRLADPFDRATRPASPAAR